MRKVLLLMLLLTSMTISAQNDVTKFLGIPVDGYKSEMKKNLTAKGFTYNSQNDFFEGEFNGNDVRVYIATNNNKVWRIMICDENTCGEGDIKIRFNNLCRQFDKNKKYLSTTLGITDFTIPQDEDISYEMLVHSKRYEASYYQAPEPSTIDTLAIQKQVREVLLQDYDYTQEELDNPSDEQREEIEKMAELVTAKIAINMLEKKLVWFMISEKFGRYYITMFYDNEYNHSDGEDL